ncbi:hypothetical protein ABNG02_00875 [Halorubrum ejinorense]|uniref:Uncharacterized protein n=1 Tax=Halorubrum ejinorense TaxID=425309 RepID=A0AAV3SMH8_9EURY
MEVESLPYKSRMLSHLIKSYGPLSRSELVKMVDMPRDEMDRIIVTWRDIGWAEKTKDGYVMTDIY